nr:glycosyltransferase [Thiothrix fructosivorans]
MNNTDQPNKPWVAYVGPFRFPDGGAAARRILGNALSIYEAGYDVKIISGQTKEEIKTEIPDFLEVISTEERTAEKLPQFLKRIIYLTMGRKTYNWFKSQNNKPNYIILYSGYTPYILWMKYYCKKNKIPLFFDAVEWYDQNSVIKNILSPYQWNIEFSMRFLLPKLNGLIVISEYLQKIYEKKSIKTIKIPPTIDTKTIIPTYTKVSKKPLTIAYTGTPGSKDLLNELLEAICYINENDIFVTLCLAGITEPELIAYDFFKKTKRTDSPSYIKAYGKINHDAAIKLVGSSDFSILFREKNKVSSAGFPTKLVESLSVGTPLIANITGDIGIYLLDGINSFVCQSPSKENITNAIERALSLQAHEYENMRFNARKTAIENFDYRHYTLSFKNELFK